MVGCLQVKLLERNPVNAAVEPNNAGPFAVAIADSLPVIRNLARVMAGVVSEWSVSSSSFIIHFRFPVRVRLWVKLIDLEGGTIESTEATHGAVHDIAGNALNPVYEVNVFLPIQWTIINLPIPKISVVQTLLYERQIVGIIDEGTAREQIRIRGPAVFWQVDPTGTVGVVPLAPGQRVVVVMRVHRHRQGQISLVIDADGAVGFFFGLRQGGQQQSSKDRNDRDDHQQFDQGEAAGWLQIHNG